MPTEEVAQLEGCLHGSLQTCPTCPTSVGDTLTDHLVNTEHPLPAPGTEDSLTARTRPSYGSLSSGVRLSSVSVEGSKVKTSLDWLILELTQLSGGKVVGVVTVTPGPDGDVTTGPDGLVCGLDVVRHSSVKSRPPG